MKRWRLQSTSILRFRSLTVGLGVAALVVATTLSLLQSQRLSDAVVSKLPSSNPAPNLTVTPATAYRYSRIYVSGAGFLPLQRVIVKDTTDGFGICVVQATADGTFTCHHKIGLHAGYGSQAITAKGTSPHILPRTLASTTFDLIPRTPTATISPMSGSEGTTVTVSGSGFVPGDPIKVRDLTDDSAICAVRAQTNDQPDPSTYSCVGRLRRHPSGPQMLRVSGYLDGVVLFVTFTVT